MLSIIALVFTKGTSGFVVPQQSSYTSMMTSNQRHSRHQLFAAMTPEEIKVELQGYLKKREELNADELAKA